MKSLGLWTGLLSLVLFSCSPSDQSALDISGGDLPQSQITSIDGNSTSSDGNFSIHYEASPHPDCIEASELATSLRCPLASNTIDSDRIYIRGCGQSGAECARQSNLDYQLIVFRVQSPDLGDRFCRSRADNVSCSMQAFVPMTNAQVRVSTGGLWP
jgi:hypothetical protein